MTNSYFSIVDYEYSGQSSFSAPSSLQRSDITVTVNGVEKTKDTDYTFSGLSIVFGGTSGFTPSTGDKIRIQRKSGHDARRVDFTAGSMLRADTLDADSNQVFYMAQEAIDTAQAISGDYNAKYWGSLPNAPASPSVGDLWFDSTNNVMKVYNTQGWQVSTSAVTTASQRVAYTVGTTSGSYDGSTTTFPVTYDSGFVDVYLNGVKQVLGSDFTATNGSTVVLTPAASSGDIVDIVAYGETFLSSDIANKLDKSGGTLTGDVEFGANKAKFLTLEIYNTVGFNSIIKETGAGNLFIQGGDLRFQSPTNEDIIKGVADGGVTLYFNSHPKVETTNAGITVTGTLTATGYNDSNWNTAYGWGDHAQAGYLTSYTESDPQFFAHAASSVTATKISNWDTTYNNHITGVNYSGSTLTLTQQDGGTLTTTINASGSSQWTTNGSNIHYSSGNVGIGTNSPNFEAHIHEATANADARIQLTNADTGTGTGKGFHIIMNGTTVGKQVNLLNREASPLALWTSNTERMRIKADGNVGIGTTNPLEKLDVAGSIRADDIIHVNSTNYARLEVGGGTGAYIDLKTPDSDDYDLRLIHDSNGSVLTSPNSDLELNVGGSPRLKVKTDGNVGIGTSSPSGKLHVSNGSSGATVNSNADDLVIESATNAGISILGDGNETQYLMFGDTANSAVGRVLYDHNTNHMGLWTNGTESVHINSAGNVGIGVDDPQDKLHVNGTVRATSLAIPDLSIGTVSGNTVISESGSGNFLLKGAQVAITDTNDHVHLLANGDAISLYYNNAPKLATVSGGVQVSGDVLATTFTGDGSNLTNLPSSGLANVVEDTTPELGGALSCNNNLISGASTIQTGDGSASAPAYTFSDDTNTGMYSPAADTIAFSEGGTERMRIDSSGRVLVGTTTTGIYGSKLKVNGRVESSSGFVATSNSSVFTQGGNYGGATISTKSYTSYSSSAQKQLSFQTSQGIERGNITIAGTSAYFNSVSDERLKENIQDSGDAGSKIDAIQIRQFDWRDSGEHQDFGVIAQELQAVAPEAVSEGYDEDDMMSVDYSKLVPTLIKEIQSLRTRVAELENN